MATLPEPILTKVLRAGFRALRKDTRIIDSIFVNMDQPEIQKVKNYILQNSIDLSINFPRTTPKLPSLILLLRNESESQAFIGNLMGTSGRYETPDSYLSYETLGTSPASGMSGLPPLAAGPLTTNGSKNHRIAMTAESSAVINDLLDGNITDPVLYVTGGKGAGQHSVLTKINPNYLDTAEVFDPQLDTTSIVEIRMGNVNEVVGEPSRVYLSNQKNLVRSGAQYQCQYQMLVLTGSQEETIYLYNIVKAILLSQAAYLEGQGLQSMQLSGSDLAPRSELLPDECFQRTLNVNFVYPFDFIEDLGDGVAFTRIDVAISCALDDDPDSDDFNTSIPL